jgi:hypothetical protein
VSGEDKWFLDEPVYLETLLVVCAVTGRRVTANFAVATELSGPKEIFNMR